MLGSPFFGPALPCSYYCAAGARLPLRLKLSRSRLSTSSALYPSRWLASSARSPLAGAPWHRGVVDAQAGPVDRQISEQMPRLDLLPVLRGQVAVIFQIGPLRSYGVVVKKTTAISLESLAFNDNGQQERKRKRIPLVRAAVIVLYCPQEELLEMGFCTIHLHRINYFDQVF